MTATYGLVVIGPPGSGKTTFCKSISDFMKSIGRKVSIVNIDPANDNLSYEVAMDVSELVTLDEVMTQLKLGPNGGLMYCMEFLEANMDWLLKQLSSQKGHYLIFDCPGQVELYTHHNSLKNILEMLSKANYQLCAVQLVDSHYCNEPAKFISALLMSLSGMLQIALPHINVLSKVDLMAKYNKKLHFRLDYYTEVLDLDFLLEALNLDPIAKKYVKLNAAMVSLIEGYGLVSFLPLDIKNKETLIRVMNAVDKANGYVYGSGEERNIQALLSCAVGAQFEHENTGKLMDTLKETESDDDLVK